MVVIEEVTEDYALEFKEKGNAAFRRGDWLKADQCFTEGLGLAEPPLQSVLLANRCQARLNAGQPARAHEDACHALRCDRSNSKALYRKARCEMLLGRYTDATKSFKQLACGGALPAQFATLEQEILRRQKQASGEYDFVQLLEQPPKGDAASFFGPVEVAKVEGKGRGVVVTRDVKRGELLFAESSFAQGDGLEAAVANKLRTCSQQDLAQFNGLCEGDGAELPLPPPRGEQDLERTFEDAREVDRERVQRVLGANAHVCEQLDLKTGLVNSDTAGLWCFASLVNHSCVPNATRSFFGDLLVCRACTDLKKGDEVLDAYVSTTQPLHERRTLLSKKYGFEPDDARARVESAVLPEKEAVRLLAQYDAAACSSRRFQPLCREIEELAAKGGSDAALVCGSLLCVFAGHALTSRVKGENACSAFARCCEIAQCVAPYRAHHAGFAWELCQQAAKHKDTAIGAGKALRYCRHVFELFYGPGTFDHLAQKVPVLQQRLALRAAEDQGVERELRAKATGAPASPKAAEAAKAAKAAPAAPAAPAAAPSPAQDAAPVVAPVAAPAPPMEAPTLSHRMAVDAEPVLSHRLAVDAESIVVEVDVPDGASASDLDVGVGCQELRVSLRTEELTLRLPHAVKPGGERVKFSSKKRRLTITLARA